NRALLHRADERVIGEVARCFREAGVFGRVELLPGPDDGGAQRALLQHGFTRTALCVLNAGLPAEARRAAPDLTVVDVPDRDRTRLEEAVRIYADGYGFAEAARPQLMDGLRDLFGKSGWQ